MYTVRLENAYEGDVLVMIDAGASEAKLMPAPSHKDIMLLKDHELVVLESQMVVVQTGGAYNRLASEIACTPIRGTAMFMLVDRYPVASHLHELHYFDKELWDKYVRYVRLARERASFFGGTERWATRIHWTMLEREQREPFVLQAPEQAVVAQPTLVEKVAAARPGRSRDEL
eukprot:1796444-Prymnesium_polylepis.2